MTQPLGLILYAEDSDDDAFLMKRAFAKANFPGTLVVVPHGVSAMGYLVGEGSYANRTEYPLPRLILLDIKMPHMGGLDVLKWIRSSEKWDETPVIMLTSSSQPSDVETAYKNGANCYLVKPTNLDAFRELVEGLIKLCALERYPMGILSLRGAVPPPSGKDVANRDEAWRRAQKSPGDENRPGTM